MIVKALVLTRFACCRRKRNVIEDLAILRRLPVLGFVCYRGMSRRVRRLRSTDKSDFMQLRHLLSNGTTPLHRRSHFRQERHFSAFGNEDSDGDSDIDLLS